MTAVIELTPSNFNGQTLKKYKNKCVLIMFYTPWCGYCTRAKPEYEELAKKIKNNKNIIISNFNCEKYEEFIQSEFNSFSKGVKILGYPTILLYKNGVFLKQYDKERSLDSYLTFLNTNC